MIARIPSLDELAADPAKVTTMPPEITRALTFRCLTVLAALASASGATNGAAPEGPGEVSAALRRGGGAHA